MTDYYLDQHPPPSGPAHRSGPPPPQDYENTPPPPRHHGDYLPPPPANGDASYDRNAFPPPPRQEHGGGRYPEDDHVDGRGYSYGGGPRDFDRYERDRPYVPLEPRAHDGNALAPYNQEKAYAEYTDAYGAPDYGSGGGPSPRGGYYGDHERRYDNPRRVNSRDPYDEYDDRRRSHHYEGRRNNTYPPLSSTRSDYYDDDDYPRQPPSRKRDSTSKHHSSGKDILRGGDGERGLGATLLGGAAGAFLGDQADKGVLGTVGGAVLGAVAAGALDRQVGKREQSKGLRKKYDGEPRGDRREHSSYGSRGGTVGPPPPRYRDPREKVEEFRPRREGRRGGAHGKGRGSSSDSYTSDD